MRMEFEEGRRCAVLRGDDVDAGSLPFRFGQRGIGPQGARSGSRPRPWSVGIPRSCGWNVGSGAGEASASFGVGDDLTVGIEFDFAEVGIVLDHAGTERFLRHGAAEEAVERVLK